MIAFVLVIVLLIPSAMLWTNISFLKTSVFSVFSQITQATPGSLSKNLAAVSDEIDAAATDYVGFHNFFVNTFGFLMRSCGNRVVKTGQRTVVRLDSGGIFEINNTEKSVNPEKIAKQNAASVGKLNVEMAKKGIPLLFVLAPCKLDPDDPGLPIGYEDNMNGFADSFLRGLDEEKVRYIDLRDYWRENNIDYSKGFFATDTHWTAKYALLSWKYVVERLQTDYGIENDVSLLDGNHLNVQELSEISLGNTGRIVGRGYVKPDDAVLYTPKYETSFRVVNTRLGWDKTGSMEETMTNPSAVKTGDVFTADLIDYYAARDSVVENYLAKNEKSVLFIRDSFGGSLGGFVPLMFKKTSILDLRVMSQRPGETVQTVLDSSDPDLAIIFYYIGSLYNEEMFDFFATG